MIKNFRASTTLRPAVTPAPSCPACGSLECFCRPRFFDGQLLSADDLTRLENYMVKKNRLHNRYLNDWGVVAGLEVVCHSCKDQVIVRQGYALSPCGDDIVVCGEVGVPICDLINQCRPSRADDCYSTGQPEAENGCADDSQEWVLMICYDEKPSRGITPLRNVGQTNCGCGGGCNANSGSGCSSCRSQTPVNAPKASSRYSPARCEPSLVCEGYRFAVKKVTPAFRRAERYDPGSIRERFMERWQELATILPQMPATENYQDLRRFCCELRDALREFFHTHGTHDCLLDERLARLVCPEDDRENLIETLFEEILIIVQYFCPLLLPPVPEPAQENCVPLATITVDTRRGNCRIIDVCNLDTRKFAITIPALRYWTSWLQIENPFKQICCSSTLDLKQVLEIAGSRMKYSKTTGPINFSEGAAPKSTVEAEVSDNARKAYTATPRQEVSAIFANAWQNRAAPVDLQSMVLDLLGLVDSSEKSSINAAERRNPLATLFAHQLAVPFIDSFMPSDLRNDFTAAAAKTGPVNDDIESLKAQVNKLNDLVTNLNQLVLQQQVTIANLGKKK